MSNAAERDNRERTLLVYGDDLTKIADAQARWGRGVYWLESIPKLRDLGLVERVPTPDGLDATWNLTNAGRSELKTRFPDYTPPTSRTPVSGYYIGHKTEGEQTTLTLMKDSVDRLVTVPTAAWEALLEDEGHLVMIIARGLTVDPEAGTIVPTPPTPVPTPSPTV